MPFGFDFANNGGVPGAANNPLGLFQHAANQSLFDSLRQNSELASEESDQISPDLLMMNSKAAATAAAAAAAAALKTGNMMTMGNGAAEVKPPLSLLFLLPSSSGSTPATTVGATDSVPGMSELDLLKRKMLLDEYGDCRPQNDQTDRYSDLSSFMMMPPSKSNVSKSLSNMVSFDANHVIQVLNNKHL